MTVLLALAKLSVAIFPNDTPSPERVTILSPYFKPHFESVLQIHPDEMDHLKFKKNPFGARGFIVVSPPKGSCFIVKRREETPDDMICAPTTLSFRLDDIDYRGRIKWQVITGKGDFGTKISWQTPYRLGQYMPPGKLTEGLSLTTIMIDCKAFLEPYRHIKLTNMAGKQWIINFPEHDKLMPQPEPGPNLYYSKGTEKTSYTTAPKEVKEDKEKTTTHSEESSQKHDQKNESPKNDPKKSSQDEENDASEISKNLFRTHESDVASYVWILTPKDTYEMSSDHFIVDGSPKGGSGVCRYRFVGAPFDSPNGLLECLDTETFDAIMVPIVCGQHLARPSVLPKETVSPPVTP